MEKAGVKTRDIQFFSQKNGRMICVHNRWARDYAKHLERESWVAGYETGRPLDLNQFTHVNPIGIRSSYFQTAWVSDFFLQYADGRCCERELTTTEALRRQAVVEKLELSRRYWSALDVADWKVVIADAHP